MSNEDEDEDEDVDIILKKCFMGELYDITFTTKGNIFGELKNEQSGNTLTLEKLLTELFFIEETSNDDKTSKRILRTKFLLACYYENNHLQELFEEFTRFLNGGTNTNSSFIINVSGGNLVILFAYLIIDIKNEIELPYFLINYFPPDLINKCRSEINETIIDLANAVVTPSKSVVFSDLDFYIINNSNYINDTHGGGDPPYPPTASARPEPGPGPRRRPRAAHRIASTPQLKSESNPKSEPLRRSSRNRNRTETLLEKTSNEYDQLRIELEEKRKLREKQKKEEEQQKKEEAIKIEKYLQDNTNIQEIQKIQKIPEKRLPATQNKEGFCVYRIKTKVCLEDYLDLVLEDWPYKDKEPEPLKEFKDTLLDFFNFYVENRTYSVSQANTYITREEYELLYKYGLPTTIGKGKGKIEIYPQLFQEKFLNTNGLSEDCIIHLNNLKNQKKIIEAAKNLNIYLLIESLKEIKETYKFKDNYNLMLFLNKLCYKINVNLQNLNTVSDKDIFQSLNTLRKDLVNEIIQKIENVLKNDDITIALVTKLKNLLLHIKSERYPNIFLKNSRTYIQSNPQIDINIKDAIKNGIFFYYNDTAEEPHTYVNEDELMEIDGGGKKLKKSKKKRNVYKKTRKKHNKKINIENPYNSKKLIKNKKTRKKHNKKKRETIKKLKKLKK